jgi:hypothetical protein
MKMARLAPRHPSSQPDYDDEEDLFRSQTWVGAGDPDAAAPLPEALGLGLAARALPTPRTPSPTTRMTPASRALTPLRREGGNGGGAFIAP